MRGGGVGRGGAAARQEGRAASVWSWAGGSAKTVPVCPRPPVQLPVVGIFP